MASSGVAPVILISIILGKLLSYAANNGLGMDSRPKQAARRPRYTDKEFRGVWVNQNFVPGRRAAISGITPHLPRGVTTAVILHHGKYSPNGAPLGTRSNKQDSSSRALWIFRKTVPVRGSSILTGSISIDS